MSAIGPYELLELLGQGAMGEVWKAVLHGPHGFRRVVALKLLAAGPDDAVAEAALAHEARLGALVQHPNVVAVHGLAQHDGRWCVAMELVDGASVARLAALDRIGPRAALEIGLQTCAALAHIHALPLGAAIGIVHRDVKPSNLLVDRYGLVKLADLGIARAGGASASVAGTPGFMAPEQVRGEDEPRSDLFALGATLYRLLTGRRPFPPKAADQLVERLADPRFAAELDDVVPGAGAVLSRCLAIRPDDRPPDAATLGEELRHLMPGAPRGPGLAELVASTRGELQEELRLPTGETPPATRSPGTLPHRGDVFVGRQTEVRTVKGWVAGGARLVSVLGPGGMGKTRLALEAVAGLRPELPGGCWFFDLSECRTLPDVCGVIGAAMHVPVLQADPVGQIGRVLGSRGRAAYVLDNFEQVVEVAADAVSRWVERAPDATFVVTSRRRFTHRDDRTLELGPMSEDDGAALFVARVRRVVSDDDHVRIRELVTRLDGMPLAIELAAARTRLVPISEVLARLHDRFRLLAGGEPGRPARQRSLRASLDGSWELLRPWERQGLAQLAVFAGSFELAAADAVLALDPGAPWTSTCSAG